MKEIKAYECEFCAKYRKTKKSVTDHEPKCFKNPDSKSCITCSKFSTYWDEVGEKETRVCSSSIDLNQKLKTECVYHQDIKE